MKYGHNAKKAYNRRKQQSLIYLFLFHIMHEIVLHWLRAASFAHNTNDNASRSNKWIYTEWTRWFYAGGKYARAIKMQISI